MQSSGNEIVLVRPEKKDERAVLDYRDEFLRNNEPLHGTNELQAAATFDEWLQLCSDSEITEKLLPGRVLATQYLGVRQADGKIVGMIQIRHALTDHLRLEGGNIGYSVRKSERRKGYGTLMLHAALGVCKELGLQHVLLTCNPENLASAGVIKANGGSYEKQVTLENGSKRDHYWITVRSDDFS